MQTTRRELMGRTAAAAAIAAVGWRTFGMPAGAAGATPPYGDLGLPDANGVRLPPGFSARLLARTGEPVLGTDYVWHGEPDGAATFATGDGGWVLSCNSELNGNSGGASAIRFDSAGEPRAAYRILSGTKWNCAGGATPWGTWLSCEEFRNGLVWECDPFKPGQGIARPGLGTFIHEAAPTHPRTGFVYLTEDDHDGRLYRFRPDRPADLSSGVLEVARVAAGGAVSWFKVSPKAPYRKSDATVFDRGEGAWISRDVLYFSTTATDQVWALDLLAMRIAVIYDGKAADAAAALHWPDNVTIHERTGDAFVGRGRRRQPARAARPRRRRLGGAPVPAVRGPRRLGGHRPGVRARRLAAVRELPARLRRRGDDVRDHRPLRGLMGASSRRLLCGLLAAAALVVAAPAPAGAAPPGGGARLEMVSFNVLAPIWAAPVWYPPELDPALLDASFRRARITAFLASRAATADVVCLQEVQESELPAFLDALGGQFAGAMSHNDRDWWSNWVVPELGWAPNGTAVIVRKSAFDGLAFRDIALSGDGNHAIVAEGTHRATGLRLRAASIHLDSDVQANRKREARSLVAQLPAARSTTDVLCGDFNEDTVTGAVSNVVETAGFTDVLAAVGNREPTHPFSSSYNGATRWAIIDHLVVRGARPLAGDVLDYGVWSIPDEVPRIEANLRNTGSDHFPIAGAAGL